jgi:hypothetical protein
MQGVSCERAAGRYTEGESGAANKHAGIDFTAVDETCKFLLGSQKTAGGRVTVPREAFTAVFRMSNRKHGTLKYRRAHRTRRSPLERPVRRSFADAVFMDGGTVYTPAALSREPRWPGYDEMIGSNGPRGQCCGVWRNSLACLWRFRALGAWARRAQPISSRIKRLRGTIQRTLGR